jgi:hypothetical protein
VNDHFEESKDPLDLDNGISLTLFRGDAKKILILEFQNDSVYKETLFTEEAGLEYFSQWLYDFKEI